MWHGATMYFLSDRGPEMRQNLWARDESTGAVRRVTEFRDYDITFPSIGPSDIVFQAGGRLYRLELSSEKVVEVPVPASKPGYALVRTAASLVSAGTERMVVDFAGKSLVGKARYLMRVMAPVLAKDLS